MSSFPDEVYRTLIHKISKLARESASDSSIVIRPGKDFSRKCRLSFTNVLLIILGLKTKSINEEMADWRDVTKRIMTSGAFVKARDKINTKVFAKLLYMINKAYPCESVFKGYHLIAVDGSDLNIAYNPDDSETFLKSKKSKGINQLHLNCAYDILSNRYVDAIINGKKKAGEPEAMWKMAERYPDQDVIFIADRGYPSWNTMEHIKRNGKYFLIRAMDIHSRSSMLRKFNLPDTEFDLDVEAKLTTRQSRELKKDPEYRFLSTTSVFDFKDEMKPFYIVNYRVVRFKIESDSEIKYECIITNLDRKDFPAEVIKKLYNMRWGIEVSFRELKYSADISVQHAKRKNRILQEAWAKMILYNLSMIITMHVKIPEGRRKRKYTYILNRTAAIHYVRDYISQKRKGGHCPPDLEEMISKEIIPVRPGRSNPRKMKPQSLVPFNYRFS